MRRVLLTGMSGTGKSSVVWLLAARGYKAVDTDEGWSELLPGGRQQRRQDAIQELPATEDATVLFLPAARKNQAHFHDQFDCIILLPAQGVAQRRSRTPALAECGARIRAR